MLALRPTTDVIIHRLTKVEQGSAVEFRPPSGPCLIGVSAPVTALPDGAGNRDAAAKYLSSSHTHEPGRCLDRQPPVQQIVRHTKPRQLPFAHFDHRHRTPPRTNVSTTACPVTSLSGTRVTSLSVIYTRVSAMGRFGKLGAMMR
jgi:hypothetical protein